MIIRLLRNHRDKGSLSYNMEQYSAYHGFRGAGLVLRDLFHGAPMERNSLSFHDISFYLSSRTMNVVRRRDDQFRIFFAMYQVREAVQAMGYYPTDVSSLSHAVNDSSETVLDLTKVIGNELVRSITVYLPEDMLDIAKASCGTCHGMLKTLIYFQGAPMTRLDRKILGADYRNYHFRSSIAPSVCHSLDIVPEGRQETNSLLDVYYTGIPDSRAQEEAKREKYAEALEKGAQCWHKKTRRSIIEELYL